jgi:hypothetical protein
VRNTSKLLIFQEKSRTERESSNKKAAAGAGCGPLYGPSRREPRRSLAIRALPLPDSILLAETPESISAVSWASLLHRILSSLYRLLDVAKGTPTRQKAGNRSIAFLLSDAD